MATPVENENENENAEIKEDARLATPEDLLNNTKYFIGSMTKTRYVDDYLEDDLIDKLNSSLIIKPDSFVPFVKMVIAEAYIYNDALDFALNNAQEVLNQENDHITAAWKIFSFLQSKTDDLKDMDKLSKTAEILSGVANIVEDFTKGMDACLDYYQTLVAPELRDKIIPNIQELTWNYNYATADAEVAIKELSDLPELLRTQIEAIPYLSQDPFDAESSIQQAKDHLVECMTPKADKCEKDLSDALEKLQQVFGSN